jgi:hypothetical protein
MMAAFTHERDQVLVEDVQAAIDELQWPEFHDRIQGISEGAGDPASSVTGRFGARRAPGLYVGGSAPGRPESAAPVAKLVVVADGKTLGELPLAVGRTIIGRTPDNDLQIDSRFVSRHHCQIITKPDSCLVEDLNSTNGIVVKSRRVRRHNLNDGDIITIGRHDLIYLDQRAGSTGNHSSATVAAALRDQGARGKDGGEDAQAAEEQPAHGETQRL